MAFLSKLMLEKAVYGYVVNTHPILKDMDIPMNVKQAYIEGCVFAVLVDDGKIGGNERQMVYRIGRSLRMCKEAIAECFDVVLGLQESDRGDFVGEMLATISSGVVGLAFLVDCERLMLLHGEISEENYRLLDEFGLRLTGLRTWREEVDRIDMPSEIRCEWEQNCGIAKRAGSMSTIEALKHITERRWGNRKKLVCDLIRSWWGILQNKVEWCWHWSVEHGSRNWHGYPIALVVVAGVVGSGLAVLLLYWLWLLLCWLGWVCIPIALSVFFTGGTDTSRGPERFLNGICSGIFGVVAIIALLIKIFG